MNDLKPGDKVQFDIEGHDRSPFGFGQVVKVNPNGAVMIKPEYEIFGKYRMTNIKKVEGSSDR